MRPAKVSPDEYIDFLIATPRAYSATEAARVRPDSPDPPAHDAFTRLLTRLEPDPETLRAEARTQVREGDGVLVVDDSALDKPYARSIELVTRHWSGKHRAVVSGINLVTLLWTDADRHIPCDYRLYDRADGKTKNDHFADMVRMASARGSKPRCVVFDGWYSSLDNLKLVRDCGWTWLTRFKSNRLVSLDRGKPKALWDAAISAAGAVVWVAGYGSVKVSGAAAPDGGTAYRATNDPGMPDLTRLQFADFSWRIEHSHWGLKRCTGGGASPVPLGPCAAEPHRAGVAGVPAAGGPLLRPRRQVGGSQDRRHREAVRACLARTRFRLPTPAIA